MEHLGVFWHGKTWQAWIMLINGYMQLSTHRTEQLERVLRKLRNRAFECERCADLIPKVKEHLALTWAIRSNYAHQKHWMYAAE